jgi:hypothetical protein
MALRAGRGNAECVRMILSAHMLDRMHFMFVAGVDMERHQACRINVDARDV